jgi:hypothetical protein
VQAGVDWPTRLVGLAADLPAVDAGLPTGAARRAFRFPVLRDQIGAKVCAEAVGGTRLDNLVCDGFLPLLAAEAGRELGGLWFHWFPGDLPPLLARSLRGLGVVGSRDWPACHGLGQGLLGWLLEREQAEASGGSGSGTVSMRD